VDISCLKIPLINSHALKSMVLLPTVNDSTLLIQEVVVFQANIVAISCRQNTRPIVDVS